VVGRHARCRGGVFSSSFLRSSRTPLRLGDSAPPRRSLIVLRLSAVGHQLSVVGLRSSVISHPSLFRAPPPPRGLGTSPCTPEFTPPGSADLPLLRNGEMERSTWLEGVSAAGEEFWEGDPRGWFKQPLPPPVCSHPSCCIVAMSRRGMRGRPIFATWSDFNEPV
jgi:hypothetical protein